MKTITLGMLVKHGACSTQTDLFQQHFPSGSTEVTQQLAATFAGTFDFAWAAVTLLNQPARQAYDKAVEQASQAYDKAVEQAWQARQARNEAVEQAWQARNEAVEQAWQARNEAVEQASQARNEAVEPARQAYDKAMEAASQAYDKAMACAFAEAFLSMDHEGDPDE